MGGSEAPVLFWRNETMGDALGWIDQLNPDAAERAMFFEGTARALYFDKPMALAPLRLPFDPWERARAFPATLWSRGLPVEQGIAGRLVTAWLAAGAPGHLGDFAERLLDSALQGGPRLD
jgi:hypothetical protein